MRVKGLGLRCLGVGFRGEGSDRVWGLGFRCLWIKVQG